MKYKSPNRVGIFRLVGVSLLLIIFIRGCVIPGIQFYRLNSLGLTDKQILAKKDSLYNECMMLFKDEVRQKAQVLDKFILPSKSGYLELRYNDIHVFVHRIDLEKNVSLNNLVKLENREHGQTQDEGYAGTSGFYLQFLYSSKLAPLANHLFITFDGRLTNSTLKSDSIINLNFDAKTASFRTERDGSTDMVFKCLENKAKIYINTLLLKRSDSLYVIVAVSGKGGVVVGSSFILDMLK